MFHFTLFQDYCCDDGGDSHGNRKHNTARAIALHHLANQMKLKAMPV
jgi:hypothetical protein